MSKSAVSVKQQLGSWNAQYNAVPHRNCIVRYNTVPPYYHTVILRGRYEYAERETVAREVHHGQWTRAIEASEAGPRRY